MDDDAMRPANIAHRPTATWLTLLLALAAGGVTLAILQAVGPVFHVDAKHNIQGLGASDEKWAIYLEQKRSVEQKNVALITGVLGATMGIALALVRPAAVSVVWRLMIGAILGLTCGLIAGLAGSFLQQYFASQGQVSVIQSAMVHSMLFALLGLGLGAISGWFTGAGRRVVERATAGLVAGLIAGIAYSSVTSVLFATVNMEATIPPTLAAQILWLAMGSGILGWLIPRETK